MIHLKKFKLPPYVCELWVAISDDPEKDVPKVNKRYYGLDLTWESDTAASTSNHFYKDKAIGCFLWDKFANMNTIVHEAVHVTTRIFQHSGAELSAEDDEHLAYWVAHITDLICKAHNEFNKKKQKKKQEHENSLGTNQIESNPGMYCWPVGHIGRDILIS